MSGTVADLTVTITVAALQERVALDILRHLNDLLNNEIPYLVDEAVEELDGLPFELEVSNVLAVRHQLDAGATP